MSLVLRRGGTSPSCKPPARLSISVAPTTRATSIQSQLRFLSRTSISPPASRLLASPPARSLLTPRSKSPATRSLATTSSTSPASTSPSPQSASPDSPLSWNAYLPLRRKRRIYNTISSLIAGCATFAGGISFLATQDLERLSGIVFGLDPFIALGACGLAFGALGWLTGPFAGEAVFRVVYRRFIAQMEVKEKDLFRRIKKYRCDPSSTNVSNPVPDYYGEKISSVQGYRQWLKDQRNFAKKRQTLMV